VLVLLLLAGGCRISAGRNHASRTVVYQSDFGLSDGAVSAMKGVAHQVDPELKLQDLTHAIEPFNIWEGAYRLSQTAPYWPANTVFVSVIDPGVGTGRRSIVARTQTGQLFVTPDNGTLTLIAEAQGIESVRVIDESSLRLPGSHTSSTFHGRDVYSYVGALLASGRMRYEQVGSSLDPKKLVRLPYQEPVVQRSEDGVRVLGMIPVLDPNFGNVWTNIPADDLARAGAPWGASLEVRILHGGEVAFEGLLTFVETFGSVARLHALAYRNSLGNLAFAVNQGSFAERFAIGSGNAWTIEVRVASR
jgi:S-adenosylmethionine hydrolase